MKTNTYDVAASLWRLLGKLELKEPHRSSYDDFVSYTRRVNLIYFKESRGNSITLIGDVHAKSVLQTPTYKKS